MQRDSRNNVVFLTRKNDSYNSFTYDQTIPEIRSGRETKKKFRNDKKTFSRKRRQYLLP